MANRSKGLTNRLLQQLFAEEFRRARRSLVPHCDISFYPYRGLTNTIRVRNGCIYVRLSDLLVNAPPEILRSVLAILLSKLFGSPPDEQAQLRYRRFANRPLFRQRVNQMRRQRGVKRLSSPCGKVFDLCNIFKELNRIHFDNQIVVRHLSWSERASHSTLGHFDSAHRAIIVNRRLDDSRVPPYVVSYVLYHEMLHAFFGEESTGDGRRIHHRRFREVEKRFPDYHKARAFLRDHFHRLKLR